MRRYISLESWGQVRTINWMLGALGLMFALFSLLSRQGDEERDRRDRQEMLKWPGRTIHRLAFSPDGKTIVGFGSWKLSRVPLGETRAWDVRTGKRLWTESVAGSEDPAGAFLPDGSAVVTVRASASSPYRSPYAQPEYQPGDSVRFHLTIRDTRSGRLSSPKAIFVPSASKTWSAGYRYTPRSLDVSPDGRAVAAALEDGVIVWDAPSKTGDSWQARWLPAIGGDQSRPVEAARFTRNGRHLVVLRTGRSSIDYAGVVTIAEVWDARTGSRVRYLDGSPPLPEQKPTGYTNQRMALSPDRQRIATLSHRDFTIRLALWDVATGKRVSDCSTTGFSPEMHFGLFRYTPERKAAGAKDPARDIVAFRVVGISDWWCWVPGTDRIERKPPGNTFVAEDNEAVSPDGRQIARPAEKGASHPVRLYEFGAKTPTAFMK